MKSFVKLAFEKNNSSGRSRNFYKKITRDFIHENLLEKLGKIVMETIRKTAEQNMMLTGKKMIVTVTEFSFES